jgi:hypothetical protein
MKYIYLASKLLTYPAAYLHGFWEHLVCRLCKIDVPYQKYLRDNSYCGHVEHEVPHSTAKTFLVCFLPTLAQSILALIFLAAGALPILFLKIQSSAQSRFFVLETIALYLGLSFACNLIPHPADTLAFYDRLLVRTHAYGRRGAPLPAKIIFFCFAVLCRVGTYLEKTGLAVILWIGFALLIGLVL